MLTKCYYGHNIKEDDWAGHVTCTGRGVGDTGIWLVNLKEVKVKVKFTLEQATKAHRGSRNIALLFP